MNISILLKKIHLHQYSTLLESPRKLVLLLRGCICYRDQCRWSEISMQGEGENKLVTVAALAHAGSGDTGSSLHINTWNVTNEKMDQWEQKEKNENIKTSSHEILSEGHLNSLHGRWLAINLHAAIQFCYFNVLEDMNLNSQGKEKTKVICVLNHYLQQITLIFRCATLQRSD